MKVYYTGLKSKDPVTGSVMLSMRLDVDGAEWEGKPVVTDVWIESRVFVQMTKDNELLQNNLQRWYDIATKGLDNGD